WTPISFVVRFVGNMIGEPPDSHSGSGSWRKMRSRTYFVLCGVSFGVVGLFLIVSGGCPFFPLFPPIAAGTPCELTPTGSIGLIFGATGGVLVIAVEIA